MFEMRLGDQLITVMAGSEGVAGAASYPNYDIDHVYVISASVLDYSMNTASRRAEMNTMMLQMGIETPPEINTTWANAGDVSQDYLDKLPAALADAEGKQNVLFLFHGFGNDVSQSGPWPGGAQLFRERVEQLITMVKDAGHNVIWSALTYRTPDGSNPASPYNERLLKPLLRRINPDAITGDDFVYDLYSPTLNHPEWIVSDGIHPNSRGRQDIRFQTVRMLDRIMNGYKVPSRLDDYYGRKLIVNFGLQETFANGMNGIVEGVDAATGATSTDGSSITARLYDTDGNPLYGPYVRTLHADVNTAGAEDNTSTELGALNGELLNDSIFISEGMEGKVSINNLPNGLTGTMTISAARTSTEPRVGEYTYREVTQTMDGAYQPGGTVPTLSWRFAVEDNSLELTWVCQTGGVFSYLNGIEIDFDDDPFRTLNRDYTGFNTQSILVSDEGAAFDLLDTSKMFKDVEGTQPVENFGDIVKRINSSVEGVYLFDEGNGATIVSKNRKPVLQFGATIFRLAGVTPRYSRPVISHGTFGSPSSSVLYWYNREGSGYAPRKWGVIVRPDQYRAFRNDGLINVVTVPEWNSFHSVYLNRVDNQITVDGSVSSFSSSDETYADTDSGFTLGGYSGSTSESYNGVVTYFVISDSPLDQTQLNEYITLQRDYLDI